jgi:hypothetical protein
MSVIIKLNESSATLRVVPLPPLVQSNGTSACTNESGATFFFSVGGVYYGSGGSISAVSAPIGLYECLFSASKVSVQGQGAVHYSSGTALPARTPIEIVRTDSYDSMRMGLFALPNAAPQAADGIVTFGTSTGQLHVSSGSVGLKAQTHSQATVTGINNILAGTYSDVSFSVRNGGIQVVSVGAGNYSGVSVEIKSKGIAVNSIETAAAYSHVTWQGISNYANISNVTLAAGTHSNVTIKGIENYANISSVTLNIGTHSGATIQGVTRVNSSVTIANGLYSSVTVRIEGVNYSDLTIQGVSNVSSAASLLTDIWAPAVRSGVTIDGVKIISTAGERSIASSFLSTNLGGTRTIQQSFHAIRNRVQMSGSTGTVYLEDDTTSSWTFTVSTGTATVYQVDPGIA